MTSRVELLMPSLPTAPELDFSTSWRVGLLVPASNSVMEVDFYRSLPHDTTLHTGRVHMPDRLPDSVDRLLKDYVLPAARSLGTVLPHIVVFGSTGACLGRGLEYDEEICRQVSAVTGAETISVAASVVQALRDTRATRIAVVTPFTDEVNEQIRAFLESQSFELPALHGMGIPRDGVASVTAESIYAFVQARVRPSSETEALYLAGTNCRAMSALSLLKVAYDMPIVTANFATLQTVKRRLHALRDERGRSGQANG
jgi:maleate isomerase